MTAPFNPQQLHATDASLGREPIRIERYDTRSRDLRALTPGASGTLGAPVPRGRRARSFWRESLTLMEQYVEFGRRKVRTDDQIYQCGETFETLYLISSGLFKIVNLAPDGREQPAGLFFKGDWLGFDGIPSGRYGCSAIALDTGELWTIRYDTLLQASAKEPLLMRLVLAAVSAQLARNRDATLSMGTLSADARVADFLLQWANSLAERGMRTDQINVHMSRAEIGNYLGLRLESVSRALSRLARCGVIHFNERGRRDISIPDLDALSAFIQSSNDSAASGLH
ncbi:Crp/Fnr family transcriptional regulator [Rhodoferax sp.]|uniref:Crp/Fnr family transcriptional regulator n=1 Tax=Rhodoferax sp. TaxID=50421 RepID=UPI001ED5A141|nr:Crp/Fnr family transcriptional regulator [Rhodoferax sp.]MBT9505096.1 Crp/Fnr family transcriptional regulator [Rhodoferax sp.]